MGRMKLLGPETDKGTTASQGHRSSPQHVPALSHSDDVITMRVPWGEFSGRPRACRQTCAGRGHVSVKLSPQTQRRGKTLQSTMRKEGGREEGREEREKGKEERKGGGEGREEGREEREKGKEERKEMKGRGKRKWRE